jgi:CDP-glycerol glycerophosphotransferase
VSEDDPVPLLSLVLVVHREQGWLPELAESVLSQDFRDLELIAIDDASPDHAPGMLDALAERDARVRVRHLAERVGPGEARNLGLEMASGDYAWFVSSTDVVPEGALAGVAGLLAGAARPAMLLVNHVHAEVTGGSRPGPHAALSAELGGEGGTLDSHPQLAAAALGAFDKLFRVELLRELGLRFGPGAFSELTLTWPLLLGGERAAGDPEPRYIRRRPPNAMREGSPFDAFAQYDAVLAREAPDERRRLVFPAMLKHELGLLGGLPEGERRRFFELMSEGYRGAGQPPLGSRALELRARLVERGDWRAYRLFEESLATRRKLAPARVRREVRRRAKQAARVRSGAVQRHYRRQLREPLDPNLAVFAAYWYRGYSCNPRAIYERLRELRPEVHGVWLVNTQGAQTIPDGVDYAMSGTREYYDLIARASWFVNNVNFPNNVVKREGTVHVMTHHGTPLKRMGLDVQKPAGAAGLLRRCARWDFSVSQNAFTTPIWERVYPTRYESLETGYPRNDVLANARPEEAERIRAELGIEPGQRAVLYTPTHREYQEEYVPLLDPARVAGALGDGWVFLARAHYFYGDVDLARGGGRVIDVSGHPSIEELCQAADVLVTDYSSIMFDYAVLDRPIVIYAPDWEEYREKRGTTFDLTAEPPGLVARSEPQLVEALRAGDEASALRAAFRARFCYLDDGRAAERVVRRVWLGEPVDAPARAATEAVAP